MNIRRKATLTPDEARQFHYEALVIDAQQPATTYGFLFTEKMREALTKYCEQGATFSEAVGLMSSMIASEIRTSEAARQQYLNLWHRSGVTVASGTYSDAGPYETAFEEAVKRIAEARSIMDDLEGELMLVRCAADIERVHRENKHGLIFDFQDTVAFGTDLSRIEIFYNLGLRVVQLSKNLRNLVADGCTDYHKGGLSYFGREVVSRLNEFNIVVDVSHCSEQVGWDALETSTEPIMVTHSSSKAVCYHDRAKSDELAKAIANRGGFFGVVLIPGFLHDGMEATLDHFVDHVEHLIDVMGINHVGVGGDKCGPGPSTGFMIEFPSGLRPDPPDKFDWSGFRPEHRVDGDYHIVGYDNFGDWPNLTNKLAERGFNEEELRKLLGLNYLRAFRDIVG